LEVLGKPLGAYVEKQRGICGMSIHNVIMSQLINETGARKARRKKVTPELTKKGG
jgi:hypothetical protein